MVNAINLGAMYSLLAIGYTMVCGIIKPINFAHGEIFMYLCIRIQVSGFLPEANQEGQWLNPDTRNR